MEDKDKMTNVNEFVSQIEIASDSGLISKVAKEIEDDGPLGDVGYAINFDNGNTNDEYKTGEQR